MVSESLRGGLDPVVVAIGGMEEVVDDADGGAIGRGRGTGGVVPCIE